MNDWTGNAKSIYTTLGASNHTESEREVNDFYATDPRAMELLLDMEQFSPKIWECACGVGHLSEVLKQRGYDVYSTDLIDRGYGVGNIDFLNCQDMFDGDIITNPPYKYGKEFVEHALELVPEDTRWQCSSNLLLPRARRENICLKRNLPKLYTYLRPDLSVRRTETSTLFHQAQ